MKKKIENKRKLRMLAVAAVAGAMISVQLQPALVGGESYALEEEEKQILDIVCTLDWLPLEEIELPESEYGTLEWVDPLYVPEEEVEVCEVILTPFKGVDVSWMEGYDARTKTVTTYIEVYSGEAAEEELEKLAAEEAEWNQAEAEWTEEASEWTEDWNEDADASAEDTEVPADADMSSDEALQENIPEENTVSGAADELQNLKEAENTQNSEPSADPASETVQTTGQAADGSQMPAQSDAVTEPAGDTEQTNAGSGDAEPAGDSEQEDLGQSNAGQAEADSSNTESSGSGESDADQMNAETDTPSTIFDIREITQDLRPTAVSEDLTEEEQQQIAEENHTCEGITVSGENLPWYVQFRVNATEDETFSNQEDAQIFTAFEFELWDLLKDEEYEIPDGEYVTVRMCVPEGYSYTVEHLLSSGARESIVPTVEGTTLAFSTHSFSPFGIAGSTVLIGGEGLEQIYATPTPTPKTVKPTSTPKPASTSKPASTPKATSTPKPSGTTKVTPAATATPKPAATAGGSQKTSGESYGTNQSANSTQPTATEAPSQTASRSGSVNTGDTAPLSLYAVLAAFAAAAAGFAAYVKKKRI